MKSQPPKVRLIPQKEAINDAQLRNKVNEMIIEAEHEKYFPLLKEWYGEPELRNLYIIFDEDKSSPVGFIQWTGPPDSATPYWWVSTSSRKKGYGRRAVEVLAEEMVRKGVKEVGDIIIDARTEGEEVASRKLARYLRKCFDKLKGRTDCE